MQKISAIILSVAISVFTVINILTVEADAGETGFLQLDKRQFAILKDCNQGALEVKQTAKHEYTAIGPISVGTVPDSKHDCWALFDSFMQTNMAVFQAWANKYCRDYVSCWCCPHGGLCVAFMVKPTSFRCIEVREAVYREKLAVFEP